MKSITSRLVAGTSLVLAVFVVLVAVSVSWSVHQRAQTARFDRLQGLIYGILGATDITHSSLLVVNSQALPDPRLNQPTSGLYAELVDNTGQRLWQSASSASWLPESLPRPIGDWLFDTLEHPEKSTLHRLQLSTAWEFDDGRELPFTVQVVDDADSLDSQLKRFDQTLWATLLASAAGLLVLQFLVLRQSLKPLHAIGDEVASIEAGSRDSLSEDVPQELESLTSGLNALLRSERERHAQYRHLLDDLAHSLKTPLSVLRNLAEPDKPDGKIILEQASLMQGSIERHVQRANLRSPRYLAPSINLRPLVERMAASLGKLYERSDLEFRLSLDPDFMVRMDEADLFEVLGNVLENACKYGARQITVSDRADQRCLTIDDDGPGFPDIRLEQLLQRGVRADSQTAGSGMGLAAAQQLMAAYGGRLEPDHAPGGGARVRLWFP